MNGSVIITIGNHNVGGNHTESFCYPEIDICDFDQIMEAVGECISQYVDMMMPELNKLGLSSDEVFDSCWYEVEETALND